MRVWFYPVDKPDVYVIVRPDPENTIVCLSDGLSAERIIEAAGRLTTREERDWVRAHAGLPSLKEDPTYSAIDKVTRGKGVWHRSMIPDGLLWTGKVPFGEHQETAER